MTWSDFYLLCFLVGFILSVLSLLLGHVHLHVPHLGGDGAHIHIPHGGHSGIHVNHGGGGRGGRIDTELSPFNFATITAFLAWFGGSGYLLTTYANFWHVLGLAMAVFFGLVGAAAIFWLMGKLVSKEENLDPADYEMVGVLGRVVMTIREGGTGEIVFVQGGTRHTAGARSEDGSLIGRDTEVVVTRYEKGIAYVRRWEDLAAEAGAEQA